ncbi:MAG: macro domain-containing protein [Clostridia bacterium]|nr:macro domain-containing protein [Clostridia bacterium]
MPFELIRNDITNIEADAIVNAANNKLLPGSGVCGAIYAAAGREKLLKACSKIGFCETGEAVITPGFDSKAKYIIHTAGPVYGKNPGLEKNQLYNCYFNSLMLARKKRLRSIAFPLISSGIYGYPKCEALDIAISAIRDFLEDSEMMVYLAVYDTESYRESVKRAGSIAEYIREKNIRHEVRFERRPEAKIRSDDFSEPEPFFDDECVQSCAPMQSEVLLPKQSAPFSQSRSLDELLSRKAETFSQMLLRLIDQKGMTDVEVYKRANIDRKLFSKIRKKDYKPKKQTVIALAVALRLNYDETVDLMARAGYAFSSSSDFDIIIKYFITSGIYDIYEINVALFNYEQPLLGA